MERPVKILSEPGIPPNGYGRVEKSGSTDLDPGFFRISRVWATVAPNGNVHVAWFDNREGEWYASDRDLWRVMRARSTNNGATWTIHDVSDPASPSLGGYAAPNPNFSRPPGDFLSIDADNQYVYIAWPDSREWTAAIAGAYHAWVYVARAAN